MSANLQILFAAAFLCGASRSGSASFWEFVIGPRLRGGEAGGGHEPRNYRSTEEIVRGYGYRLDTHLVASQTGHILTLHRIPRGRRVSTGDPKRPIVFIHHGLFGCSDMWLLRGPQQDLPYILVDSGYDVWLFNTRGNVHSRKHKFLNPDEDISYWDFGIEEMGYYDIPVTIDYILNITDQKDLIFISHSIGSSAGFITCVLKPEYNEKIRLFIALAPLANLKHRLSPLHKVIFSLGSSLMHFSQSMNVYEILPRREQVSSVMRFACEDGSPLQKLCFTLIFAVVGDDLKQLNTANFLNFLRYYPSGTSLKVVANVFQYYTSGEFARNDYESSMMNFAHYNSSTPPRYDLSRVTVPVLLYYGPGDLLVTIEDIDDLATRLPRLVGKRKIPYKYFNHLDFVLATNARRLLYDGLLDSMKKYKR